MLTDTELTDILFRVDNDMDNWRDRAKLRQHINTQAVVIEAQARTIAQLRAEVDAHDAALQRKDVELAAIQSHGGGRWLITTPTGNVDLIVNGVPIQTRNGHGTDEVGA